MTLTCTADKILLTVESSSYSPCRWLIPHGNQWLSDSGIYQSCTSTVTSAICMPLLNPNEHLNKKLTRTILWLCYCLTAATFIRVRKIRLKITSLLTWLDVHLANLMQLIISISNICFILGSICGKDPESTMKNSFVGPVVPQPSSTARSKM